MIIFFRKQGKILRKIFSKIAFYVEHMKWKVQNGRGDDDESRSNRWGVHVKNQYKTGPTYDESGGKNVKADDAVNSIADVICRTKNVGKGQWPWT